MEMAVATPVAHAHEERKQTAQRIAAEMFQQQPDWITFFREVLGVDGLLRKLFATPEELAAFEKTDEYDEIQQMLAKLRERTGSGGRRQGADAGDHRPAAQEPARVAAGRSPRPQDQHEPAVHQQAAAGDRRRDGGGGVE